MKGWKFLETLPLPHVSKPRAKFKVWQRNKTTTCHYYACICAYITFPDPKPRRSRCDTPLRSKQVG